MSEIKFTYPSAGGSFATQEWTRNEGSNSSGVIDNFSKLSSAGTYQRIIKWNNRLYMFLDTKFIYSEDGGITWSSPVQVITPAGESVSAQTIAEVGNLMPYINPLNENQLLLFYRALNETEGSNPYYSLRCKKLNTAHTLSNFQVLIANKNLSEITPFIVDTAANGLWEPFMGIRVQVTPNTYWLQYSKETGTRKIGVQNIFARQLTISTSGITALAGTEYSYTADGTINRRYGMACYTLLDDNWAMYVFEDGPLNEDKGPFHLRYCFSNTSVMPGGNVTASSILLQGHVISGNHYCNYCAPYITKLPDGRVVISVHTEENYKGNIWSETDTRNRHYEIYISKKAITHSDTALTINDFEKVKTYSYLDNEYSTFGSVNTIDGILYKVYNVGVNLSASQSGPGFSACESHMYTTESLVRAENGTATNLQITGGSIQNASQINSDFYTQNKCLRYDSSNPVNIDQLSTIGTYVVKPTQLTGTFPTGIGGDAILFVYPWSNTTTYNLNPNYVYQEIRETGSATNNRIWVRHRQASTWTAWSQLASSSAQGDVTGPASSTDNTIARFDGTTGKLIQNSEITIDDSNNLATTGKVTLKFSGNHSDRLTLSTDYDTVYLNATSNQGLAIQDNGTNKLEINEYGVFHSNGVLNGSLNSNNFIYLGTGGSETIKFESFQQGSGGYAKMPVGDGSTSSNYYTLATEEWVKGGNYTITGSLNANLKGKINESSYGKSDRILGNTLTLPVVTKNIKVYHHTSSQAAFIPSYVGSSNATDKLTMLSYIKSIWSDTSIDENDLRGGSIVMVLNSVTDILALNPNTITAYQLVFKQPLFDTSEVYFKELTLNIPCYSSTVGSGFRTCYDINYMFYTVSGKKIIMLYTDVITPPTDYPIDMTNDESAGFLVIK